MTQPTIKARKEPTLEDFLQFVKEIPPERWNVEGNLGLPWGSGKCYAHTSIGTIVVCRDNELLTKEQYFSLQYGESLDGGRGRHIPIDEIRSRLTYTVLLNDRYLENVFSNDFSYNRRSFHSDDPQLLRYCGYNSKFGEIFNFVCEKIDQYREQKEKMRSEQRKSERREITTRANQGIFNGINDWKQEKV